MTYSDNGSTCTRSRRTVGRTKERTVAITGETWPRPFLLMSRCRVFRSSHAKFSRSFPVRSQADLSLLSSSIFIFPNNACTLERECQRRFSRVSERANEQRLGRVCLIREHVRVYAHIRRITIFIASAVTFAFVWASVSRMSDVWMRPGVFRVNAQVHARILHDYDVAEDDANPHGDISIGRDDDDDDMKTSNLFTTPRKIAARKFRGRTRNNRRRARRFFPPEPGMIDRCAR